jgi:transposase
MQYDLSNETRTAIRTLADLGVTYRQIAARFGITHRAVERIASGVHTPPRPCQRKLTDAQIDEAIAMRDSGMRNQDVAAHFGVSGGTMSRCISLRRMRRDVWGE